MKLGKLGLYCILSATAILSVMAAAKYGPFYHTVADATDAKVTLTLGTLADKEFEFDTKETRDAFVAALKTPGTPQPFAMKAKDLEVAETDVLLVNGTTVSIEVKKDAVDTNPSKLTLKVTAGTVPATNTSVAKPKLPAVNVDETWNGITFKLTKTELDHLNAPPAQVELTFTDAATTVAAFALVGDDQTFYIHRDGTAGHLLVVKNASTVGAYDHLKIYAAYLVGALILIGTTIFVFPLIDAEGASYGKESSGLLSDDFKEMLPGEDREADDDDVVVLQSGRQVPKKDVIFDDSGKIVGIKKVEEQPQTIGTASVTLAALFALPFFL